MKRLTIIILALVAATLQAGPAADDKLREQELQRAIDLIESKGDLAQATPLLEDVAKSSDRTLAVRGLLQLAQAQERFGKGDAPATYQRIVNGFGGPTEAAATAAIVEVARTRLAGMGQKDTGLTVRRVWSDAADAVSPDGRYLTFTNWDTGDLTIHDLASGQDRAVTTNRKWNDNFAEGGLPSPDSRQIAYSWWDDTKKHNTLRIVSRDGGQPREIYPNDEKANSTWPAGWTPDGKWVLTIIDTVLPAVRGVPRTKNTDVRLISITGAPSRLVKRFEGIRTNFQMNLRLSPDGRSVIYNNRPDQANRERDLYRLAIDTGSVTPLMPHPADDDVLGWMPAGDRVLFVSDRGGSYGIWSVTVTDGRAVGEPVEIKRDTTDISALGITKAGDLYYNATARDSDVFVANLDAAVASPSARATRLASRFVGGKQQATWSPDGTRIAYVKEAVVSDSAPTLAVQTLATGMAKFFPLPLDNLNNPVWMPDGKTIVVQGRDKQLRQGLHRVDAETGILTSIVVREPANDIQRGSPSATPDGRQLIFFWATPGDATKGGIMIRDLASGVERRLTTEPVNKLALSPDGQWLAGIRPISAAATQPETLMITSSAGAPQKTIAAEVGAWRVVHLAWSADSRSVFVVKSGAAPGTAPEIWQVPTDGSAPRNTGIKWTGSLNRISVHPDGRRLALSASGGSTEIWVLQNLPSTRGR